MPGTPNAIRLYQGQPGTAEAKIYTAPGQTTANPNGATTIVKTAIICNTTAAAATLSLWAAPSGGSVAAGSALYLDFSVAAGDTVIADLEQYLMGGDYLAAAQGTADALTLTISGVVVQ